MNRSYLILPFILFAGFTFVYWQNSKAAGAKASQLAIERAAGEEAALRQKEESGRRAREDAEKRAAEREAGEKRQEEERRLKYEAGLAQLAEETAQYQAQFDRGVREIAALEQQLATLRAGRERRNSETFEAVRETELLAVEKRSAELEIQRLVKIVAAQAAAQLQPSAQLQSAGTL